MSDYSDSLDPEYRENLIHEIMQYLPAYVFSASREMQGSIEEIADILDFGESELLSIISAHLLLSSPVREFINRLPQGMRKPVSSSVRARVPTRTINSAIDWAATYRYRSTASPTEMMWVTRQAGKVFDLPENQVLSWVLRRLEVAGANFSQISSAEWAKEVQAATKRIGSARQVAWLKNVPAIRPAAADIGRLCNTRSYFYSVSLVDAYRKIQEFDNYSGQELLRLLMERYFIPTHDWKIFELAVLTRIVSELAIHCDKMSSNRPFHGLGKRPFALFESGESRISVWYQTWPKSLQESVLSASAKYYGMRYAATKPDIIIEVTQDGVVIRVIILELKATYNSSYLITGFSQLLSYLKERPALSQFPGNAWLVAPESELFSRKMVEDNELWICSAEDVAEAVIEDLVRHSLIQVN